MIIGIGDPVDDTIFPKKILEQKSDLAKLLPIDAFALVVKFDRDQCPSFNITAKQFCDLFGTESIKSLIIICIQGNNKRIYSDTEFRSIFYETEAYKYLLLKNRDTRIPYCLWDNLRPYDGQETKLLDCLTNLEPFTDTKFNYMCNMLENYLKKSKKPPEGVICRTH